MFKGLSGLKKVVAGGFSTVAEHSSQLAEQVVGDPKVSKDQLKESLKKKVQGYSASVVDAGDNLASSDAGQAKDKAAEVVHKVKHYGAFGEDYLGYSDPTKDLRKAVKQKEKAAKKARKAKKKQTGKKEDLFDPENLAKYKKELEEKRAREAALAAAASAPTSDQEAPEEGAQEDGIKFELQLDRSRDQSREQSRGPSEAATPLRTPCKEDKEDWQLFQSLTSGVDLQIQKKKEELAELKKESYFQQKKTAVELEEEAKKKKKKKKKWVDLDTASFEELDGQISGQEDDEGEEEVADESPDAEEAEGPEPKEEKKDSSPIGFVEVDSDEPVDLDDEEDIFNTDFVNAITCGDVKLAVIPDDPVYDDEDDPFNTSFAEVIVKKEVEEKKKEQTRLKFTGLSSVADVLSGKADKVDKSLVEHAVKRKRRRANRINLIGEQEDEVTAREDIGTLSEEGKDASQSAAVDILLDGSAAIEVPEGNLLASTPSPLPAVSPAAATAAGPLPSSDPNQPDLSEFEALSGSSEAQLTSNVAILAGEFAQPAAEEEDEFDAAFDALAQEAVTRTKLEDLEKQFADDDIFDTTAADKVLGLVSLSNKVEDEDEDEPLETFEDEDKDPFDTSAYDHITGALEEELEFESLSKRELPVVVAEVAADFQEDPFGGSGEPGADPFDPFGTTGPNSEVQEGWSAFSRPKPSRPPPPKPRRPQKVDLNPDSRPETPSVVIKAPSLESIKSWNCAVAENLIRKSEIEALEALNEADPFDTTGFGEFQEDLDGDDLDDPFDTSGVARTLGLEEPEPEVVKSPTPPPRSPTPESDFPEEEEVPDPFPQKPTRPPPPKKVDVFDASDAPEEIAKQEVLAPISSAEVQPEEVDPFDTEFAAAVLPNHGDPFDTSYVSGAPGKAEIKALEEEFLGDPDDEFDPREGSHAEGRIKSVAPGVIGGRARPKRGGNGGQAAVLVDPTKFVNKVGGKEVLPQENQAEEEEEDPFDTSIVDKVIPVRKTAKSTELSVEDEDFDPSASFQSSVTPELPVTQEEEEIDPFDTSIANTALGEPEPTAPESVQEPVLEPVPEVVVPEVTVPEIEPETKTGVLPPPPSKVKRQVSSDDDFDPRA